MTEQSGENIFGLLIASDELLLEELTESVQDYLIEKQTGWIQDNLFLVMKVIFNLPNYQKLYEHCITTVCEDPQPFFTSEEFPSLNEDDLFNLLKRNDLKIEETVVWDCLIKWGIEQTPGLGNENNNRIKWNQENFEELEKTLSQFIPLIRFVEISPNDFFNKICLYKDIIPNHIYKEVTGFYHQGILPKTMTFGPRVASTIIKPNLATIIANWIDKNDSTDYNKYKFNLIYLKSRDGFNYTMFHNKCNMQGPFVVLIKV